jgi:hypothetical protein
MPYQKITVKPGFNVQATQLLNEGGWSFGNLVRFRYGLLEKIGGWKQLFATALAGIARALHAFEDLSLVNTLLIGGDGGPQIYAGGVLYPVTEASFGIYGNVTISASAGSNIATVSDINSAITAVGQSIALTMLTTLGGEVFQAGTTFTAASVISPSSYTFLLPSNATTNASSSTPLFNFPAGSGGNVTVTLTGHGFVAGNLFKVDLSTNYQTTSVSGLLSFSAAGGSTYPVVSVIDANNFLISGFTYINYTGAPSGTFAEGQVYNGTGSPTEPPVVAYPAPASPVGNPWFVDNLGTNGLILAQGGRICVYTPPVFSGAYVGAIGAGNPFTASQINNGMFVAMPQAQIIAFGTEPVFGSGLVDPLLVRWSDAGSYLVWTASVTNQAGSFRLSRGSKIVGGLQAPQSSLLWTDVDLWSMAYIGQPLIYSFTTVASGCGLIGPHAAAVQGRNTYWMSQNAIWSFGDYGAQAIDCPLWDLIFPVLDRANAEKVTAGSNSATQEIKFFYPVIGGNGENQNYVIYNTLEQLWSYGQANPPLVQNATPFARSAWIDESVFGSPIGADPVSLLVQQHDVGYDANGAAMTGVYAETGFFDIGDGTTIPFLDQIIPDFKWFGTNGYAELTLWAQGTSGGAPTMYGPFPVTPTTGIISTGGIRGRQIALRIDWGIEDGFSARYGALRARIAPSGRVQ